MGSLIGHAVPGTAFTVLSIWWMFNFFCRFFESQLQRQQQGLSPLHGSPNSPSSRQHLFPPWEVSFRLLAIIVGILGELITAFDDQWNFVAIHNGQHMTMFAFFLFPTVIELLYFYFSSNGGRRLLLPVALDCIAGSLAFAVEAVLFLWHLHGRVSLDVQVHTFVVYAAVACSVSMALEAAFPDDIRPCLLRCCFTLLQGTWFYCVGMILYPPEGWVRWKGDDHEEMMLATMMFAWNLAAAMVVEGIVGLIAYRWTKSRMDVVRSYHCGKMVEEGEGLERDDCCGTWQAAVKIGYDSVAASDAAEKILLCDEEEEA